MRIILLALSLLLVMGSCNQESQSSDPANENQVLEYTSEAAMAVPISSATIAGVYTGVVPCADCDGIATVLEIRDDETFRLETRYQGKEQLDPFVAEGSWSLEQGRLSLNGIEDAPNTYQVEEGYLVQLNRVGEKMEGNLAEQYVLKKK